MKPFNITRFWGKSLRRSFLVLYVSYIRIPIQRSALFTDLLVVFFSLCLIGVLFNMTLIYHVTSPKNERINKHYSEYRLFSTGYHVARHDVYNLHGIITDNPKKIRVYPYLGQGRRRVIHNFPRGRALLGNKNKSNLTMQNVNEYISLGGKENGAIFHDINYSIENLICSTAGNVSKVDLLILIFSSVIDRHSRDTIRNTWLSYSNKNSNNIRYVFLLGKSVGKTLQSSVEQENAQHMDILQGDFEDFYRNLTLKTMMGMRWAVEKCNQAQFILKTDDDVWVNIPALLTFLKSLKSSTFTLGGKCFSGRPQRDPSSRYFVPYNIYPMETYPPFCSGTGYLTTPKIALKIVNVSKLIPYFHLEDVYVALCLAKMDIPVQNLDGFYNARTKDFPRCLLKTSKVLVMHRFNSNELRGLWLSKPICPKIRQNLSFNRGFDLGKGFKNPARNHARRNIMTNVIF